MRSLVCLGHPICGVLLIAAQADQDPGLAQLILRETQMESSSNITAKLQKRQSDNEEINRVVLTLQLT